MRASCAVVVLLAACFAAHSAWAQDGDRTRTDPAADFRRTLECPTRRYCTRVSTCREAVHLWCVCGYDGADCDDDGVPYETLCGQSEPVVLERVARIRTSLGCPPRR